MGRRRGLGRQSEEPDLSADFDAVDATGAPAGFAFAAPPAEPRPWGGSHGDRVEGWSRPEYDDEPEPISGEYWMPVPAGSYDPEYGWPVPEQGRPEAAPGEEPEPAVVPPWPPARPDDRVEAPRSASERGVIERLDAAPAAPVDLEATGRFMLNTERYGVELLDDNGRRDDAEWRPQASAPVNQSLDEPIWSVSDVHRSHMPDLSWTPGAAADEDAPRRFRRPVASATMRRRRAPGGLPASETLTQTLPAVEHGYSDATRSRPRPRPRPGNGQTEARSTVYVSRHAAEPN